MNNPWQMLMNQPGPDQSNSAPSGSGYPALPNTYGLGKVSQKSVPSNQPEMSFPADISKGYSPFAMIGDANARNPWEQV